MSGICGIIRLDGKAVAKEEIQAMLDAMQNRGSDAEMIRVDGNVGFGHKMLWTTPESLHETQPFLSKDGSLILTADARIDNREELFDLLEITVSLSAIITDAELILEAYKKWDKRCVEFIRGDFSFAIWDTIHKNFFSARDRIGLKPFNYFLNRELLVFSSEIPSIFSFPGIQKDENTSAIKTYLHHLAIPADETFYKGIKRLPASSRLSLDTKKGIINCDRYWFPEKIKINTSITKDDAIKEFSHLFKQAVKANMRSAYPIAFEVSGGLDSSSVLCLGETIASEQPIVPYTLYYAGLPCNEIDYIKSIEDDKKISILKIDITQFDYKEKYTLDYLFSYSGAWPAGGPWVEHLAKNTILRKKNTRVVLTGLGGDEVLSSSFQYLHDYKKLRKYGVIFREIKCMKRSFLFRLRLLASLFLHPRLKKILKILVRRGKSLQDEDFPYLREIVEQKDVTNYAYENTMSVLSTDISYWADMNPTQLSGKDNIEYRHPFYDTRLVEFLFSLPPEYRNACGISKSILRTSMKSTLPEKIRNRQDKAHFWTSILFQMQQWDMSTFLKQSTLAKESLLHQKKIETLYSSQNNSTNVIYFWIYLNLNRWYDENFNPAGKKSI